MDTTERSAVESHPDGPPPRIDAAERSSAEHGTGAAGAGQHPAPEHPAEERPAEEHAAPEHPAEEAGDVAGADPAGESAPAGESEDAPGTATPSEEDRWAAFAPAPEPPPGRPRRVAAAFGRFLSHEWTWAVLGGLALAVVMTWPALKHPRYTLPSDLGDPTLVAWILAWPGHYLTHDLLTQGPSGLWHTNAFFPDGRWSLAFTDSLLGYAPLGLIGDGPGAAVLRYNLVYVLAHALAFIGAYALVRQLGAPKLAALVPAVAFAYAPWRIAHAGHLHVLSTGGMALALAMLVRGHGWSLRSGFRARRVRPGWIVAGWLVAAWQITLGFGIGLVFGYLLGTIAVVVAVGWLVRRLRRRPRARVGPIVAADLVGGAVFVGTCVLMALPYLRVVSIYPEARRKLEEVALFSPPLRGLFVAPENSWLWGALHDSARAAPVAPDKPFWPPEMALLPGFALLAFAAAGLVFSRWSVRTRVWLAAGVVVTAGLALGTELFDGAVYRLLYEWLPGWDALRTPGRMVVWTTLLLGILAAGAVAALAARARDLAQARGAPRPGGWLTLVLLVPAALVLVEGISTTPHVVVPPAPPALASATGPMLVLPTSHEADTLVMLWNTDRFVPQVNGGSGFSPPSLHATRRAVETFPDDESVSYLRSLGVSTVVVLPDRVAGTPWEDVPDSPAEPAGVRREEVAGGIVFHLDG